jgi:hypothetical protein
MRYEPPAIERRIETHDPVITGVTSSSSPLVRTPTWSTPARKVR